MTATALLRPQRFLLTAFIVGLLASGAAQAEEKGSWWQRLVGTGVIGSGKLATEQRPVGSFQAVTLNGSMKVVLRQSGKEAVEVTADDNLVSLVETTVVDRGGVPTLEIGTKPGASFSTRSRMVVNVDLATLKSLTLVGSGDIVADTLKAGDLQVQIDGSGDVQLRRLDAGKLAVSLSGSGDVVATGRTAKLDVSIAGSGDVTMRELESDDVRVSIAGSGDARVNARKTLSVSIAGSGDVDYTGDAAVKASVAGSGSVHRR